MGGRADLGAVAPVLVHLVHGTWPYGWMTHFARSALRHRWLRWLRHWLPGRCRARRWRQRERLWFQPGSSFQRDIHASLPAELRARVRFVRFRWTGANSFGARETAAGCLRHHLGIWLRRTPEACHLVVAHSHGGTVAVDALGRWAAPPEASALKGVLTMATPFVALRPAPVAGWQRHLRYLAAALAHVFLAIALVAAGLTLWIGRADPWGNFLVFVFGGVMLGVSILAIIKEGWGEERAERVLASLVRDMPFVRRAEARATQTARLRCGLWALRVPGDEATLAIAAGQIVELLTAGLWRLLVTRPAGVLAWLDARLIGLQERVARTAGARIGGWAAGAVTVLLVWALAVAVLTAYDLAAGFPRSMWLRALAAPFYAGISLIVLFFTLPYLPLVILLPATLALAVAAGPEILLYPGLLTIDAEPLPRCEPAQECRLTILWPEAETWRALPMRHSMHQLEAVRGVVGSWIAALARV
jgi:hypothetical protein